jgi:hypothetical protein
MDAKQALRKLESPEPQGLRATRRDRQAFGVSYANMGKLVSS